MADPLVSVIIPTYNRKHYVALAIASVMRQSYNNIEIVVIDDCSKDDTYQVVVELGKNNAKIVPLRNQVNLGPAGTANAGIHAAKGKYIAILDDDDTWCDLKKIEKQVAFLEGHSDHVLVGGGVIKRDKEGNEIARYLPLENDTDIRKALLIDNVFAHSTVLYAKDAFMKVGGYQKDLKYFADWDLWLKLGTVGKLHNFQDFFDYYLDQEHGKVRSTHDYGIRRRLSANMALRTKYRKHYPGYVKSILLCCASYLYSFLPFRVLLRPVLNFARNTIFGRPPYRYVDNNKP